MRERKMFFPPALRLAAVAIALSAAALALPLPVLPCWTVPPGTALRCSRMLKR